MSVVVQADSRERSLRARNRVVWLSAVWHAPAKRRVALALLGAIGAALVFAQITEDYLTNDPLARWDVSFARWLSDHRSPAGIDLFRGITNFGSPALSLVLATFVCIVLYRRRALVDAALLPVVLGGAELLNLVLKLSFHRARPEVGFVHLDTYSYPSGHAMMAAATYGAFTFLFWGRARTRWRRMSMVAATSVLVFLIGFSRLYLGEHYLSDVLGGVAAGAAWLGLSIALYAAYGERFAAVFSGSPFDRFGRWVTRA
jgi:membrane-associated phospholipid phosphatase